MITSYRPFFESNVRSRGAMARKTIALVCALFAGMWTQTAFAADVSVALDQFVPAEQAEFCLDAVGLEGEIVQGDVQRLTKAIGRLEAQRKRMKCDPRQELTLSLNSDGGSVDEAMAIARLVRRKAMRTRVDYNQSCLSSCVFVFAGGVRRMTFTGSRIGIHRPYFSSLAPNLTYQQIQAQRFAMVKRLKEFAREMDFSEKLIDDMLAIEPADMRLITNANNPEYRIWGVDATRDEQIVAEAAAFYKISSAEYRARRMAADKYCAQLVDPSETENRPHQACFIAVMGNLPLEQAVERLARVERRCDEGDLKCFREVVVEGK